MSAIGETYLQEKYGHERDSHITFDPVPHKYTVDGETDYTSVTTWNHQFFKPFDSDAIINGMRKRANWKDSKYYGMTNKEIKKMWFENGKKSADLGTIMHENIEKYYNEVEVHDDSIEYGYFNNFEEERLRSFGKDLEPFRTEWMVWAKELKLSGSVDMVYRNKKTGHLEIYDWKRTKELTGNMPNYGKYAIHPLLDHIGDTKFWHYALQLNTYRYILENYYGYKVDKLCLVCLHPENKNKNYLRIPVPILRNELNSLMEERKKMLNKRS